MSETTDPAPALSATREAYAIALRELRLRRRSLQRRGLAQKDPRWSLRVAEITAAIALLDALLRVAEMADVTALTVGEALTRVLAELS